jgi:NAD-dependent deacetylase
MSGVAVQPSDPVPSLASVVGEAAIRLARCRRLLVLAGAGLSADAGVPTFRGEGGLWRTHKVEELASREGFAQHPEQVWEWYRERRLQVARCEPHAGQRTLALLQQHIPAPARVLVATTNEDDLLVRAGVRPVLHLHGSLFETVCAAACGWRARDAQDNSLSLVPCPRCGGAVRPGSVWFGENLPRGVMEAVHHFDPDGCLLVGSSMLVQPAAAIPVELGLAGAPVVEINPEETPFSRTASASLRGSAKDLLPRLVDVLTSDTVREQWRRIT